MSRSLVDLSHVIEDGMVTYPGLPVPSIRDHLTHDTSRVHYDGKAEFQIGEIRMVANTGTYLDAPFHRFRSGRDVSELPLAAVADLEGVLVEAPRAGVDGAERAVDADAFRDLDIKGKAVLVGTGWGLRWGTEAYFRDHPFLTAAAARTLVDGGAAVVGIESLNIDDTADPVRPAHTTLLGADIPVVEHLCGLEVLRGRAFRFHAVPLKVRGMGSFPVRAYAVVE